MSSAESVTQRWLRQNVQIYVQAGRVYADADAALARFPTLRPKTDVYTYDDGRQMLLLCLHGLLPIQFRSQAYNIPIALWVQREYPRLPPIAYVVPTNDMLVKASKNVEHSGRCTVDYAEQWERKSEACNLSALLESLQQHFSREPPVYARPKQQSQQPSPTPPPPVNTASRPQSIGPDYSARPPPSVPGTSGAQALFAPPDQSRPAIPPMPSGSTDILSVVASPPVIPSPQPIPGLGNVHKPPPPLPPAAPRPSVEGVPHPHAPPPWMTPTPSSGMASPAPAPPWSAHHGQYGQPPQVPYAGSSAASSVSPPPTYYKLPPPIPNASPAPGPLPFAHPQAVTSPPAPRVLPPNLLDEEDLPSGAPAPMSAASAAGPSITAPPPVRPPNPELLALHGRVHAALTAELASLRTVLAADAERLRAQQADLLAGAPAIRDESARLVAVRDVCRTVAGRMRDVVGRAEAGVAELRRKGEPEVDELVCSTTIVHNQLVNLVAEDNAIEDTIYHLHRALNAGRIDLERFLRTTRVLAEEQFMKRALIEKIQQGLGGVSG